MSMNQNSIAQEVLETVNSIPGVKAAVIGELKVEGLEVKTFVGMSDGLGDDEPTDPLVPAVGTFRLLEDFENVTSRRMEAGSKGSSKAEKIQAHPVKGNNETEMQEQCARAIAETCGVSFDRVKVLGFQ